jgi:serine/threonine protein kinase
MAIHHIHTMVDAITHRDIKPPRCLKQRFLVVALAAVSVAGS